MHPYFTRLPILIIINFKERVDIIKGFNPYFIGLPILIFDSIERFNALYYKVSILILLDYLFL